ncbi:unnamed protein product [Rotaria sp. Silwood1]|nr:unnamed protein product [Rotaria sp. Silwood1]
MATIEAKNIFFRILLILFNEKNSFLIGPLIANTNRECKVVIMLKTGTETIVINDDMTSGPVLKFITVRQVYDAYQ